MWGYVEYLCNLLGNLVAIITIGKEPKPVHQTAADTVLTICCILSVLFMGISFLVVCLARLTSDFYIVLSHVILSLSVFPVLVLIDTRLNIAEHKETCRLMTLFSHGVLLSNALWLMNLSFLFFLRLTYYVYRHGRARLFYVLSGWVLPWAPILLINNWFQGPPEQHSCLTTHPSRLFVFIDVAALLVALVTVLLYRLDYTLLTQLIKVLKGPEEKILCEKLESAILLHFIFILTRVLNVVVGMTDHSIYSTYVLACCIFLEGGMVFLGFVLANEELLIVLRTRYFDVDEDSKRALEDFETEDNQRLQIQKEMMRNLKDRERHRSESRLAAPKSKAESRQVTTRNRLKHCTLRQRVAVHSNTGTLQEGM
ncbi:uncharacterized protein [Ptychodera flava]|uniref:uncharacterized protein n=1 Tax=Ptychodera flava TaxID=63121 RepID=UPI00396A2CEE